MKEGDYWEEEDQQEETRLEVVDAVELSLNLVVWLTMPGTMKLKGLIKGTEGNSLDYQDFVGIMVLLIINSTISFIEENNSGNVAAAIMARLAPKAN